MQKFGYELRKIGDVKKLYNDVDAVLAKYSINIDPISKDVQTKTAAHMLHRMFKPDKWVDVCNIESCAVLCGICIREERLKVYKITHCMHWSEMEDDYRQMLMAMILDDFRNVFEYKETDNSITV